MIYFYPFGGEALIALNLIIALIAGAQTINLALLYRQFGRQKLLEAGLELVVMLYLLALLAAVTKVQYHALSGLLVPSRWGVVRMGLFVPGCVLALVLARQEKIPWPLLVPVGQLLSLPPMEALLGAGFPWAFFLSLAFWAMRTGHLIALRYWEFQHTLTRASVKEAIDKLHAGLMFCTPDGRILLENHRMIRLKTLLMGVPISDGQEFFQRLEEGRVVTGSKNSDMGRLLTYRLPDGSVWGFTLRELELGRDRYALIYASDQTERWTAVYQLWDLDQELIRTNRELTAMLRDLESICRTEELVLTRRRVHDALGQRISLLIRSLREGNPPDEELLTAFANGLPQELHEAEMISPRQFLDTLVRNFAAVGVVVDIRGTMPGSRRVATAFAEICREAISNGVRHGYASRVDIRFTETDRLWRLTVWDDGPGLADKIVEGSGLKDMRRKAREVGGVLAVTPVKEFRLEAVVPKGGQE